MPAHGKPYYRAFPADFLNGTADLTCEEHGVYRTLVDLMYDKWQPIPWNSLSKRRLVAQQQVLAKRCGCRSVRQFLVILVRLKALLKITENSSGDLVNPRFVREAAAFEGTKAQESGDLTSGLNPTRLSETNGLTQGLTRARESIVHSPDSSKTASLPGVKEMAEASERYIAQACKALGVSLQASTWRSNWTLDLTTMLADDNLDFAKDVLPALVGYAARKNYQPDRLRSLRMLRPDFLERKRSREITDVLTQRAANPAPAPIPVLTDDDWHNHLRIFLIAAIWVRSDNGPSPLEPGCGAPRHLLERAQSFWLEQGNHPQVIIVGNAKVPWVPDHKECPVKTPTPFASIP